MAKRARMLGADDAERLVCDEDVPMATHSVEPPTAHFDMESELLADLVTLSTAAAHQYGGGGSSAGAPTPPPQITQGGSLGVYDAFSGAGGGAAAAQAVASAGDGAHDSADEFSAAVLAQCGGNSDAVPVELAPAGDAGAVGTAPAQNLVDASVPGRLCDHTFAGSNGFTYIGVRFVPGPYRHRTRRAAGGAAGEFNSGGGAAAAGGGEDENELSPPRRTSRSVSSGSSSDGGSSDDSSGSDVLGNDGHWEAVVHFDVGGVHSVLVDAACNAAAAGAAAGAAAAGSDAPIDDSGLQYRAGSGDVYRYVSGPHITAVEAAWAHDDLVRDWFGAAALVNFGPRDGGVEGVVVTL